MATTKKTAKDDKRQKAAPKVAQNKPKTREALAEKKEPPRAAQMMQAYGKAKLVKELQEHRIEQKAEERRSEQAQAIDILSEEAEVTAGAAIEEGRGLLERDLQRLQPRRSLKLHGKCRHVRFIVRLRVRPPRKRSPSGQLRPGGLFRRQTKRRCKRGLLS